MTGTGGSEAAMCSASCCRFGETLGASPCPRRRNRGISTFECSLGTHGWLGNLK